MPSNCTLRAKISTNPFLLHTSKGQFKPSMQQPAPIKSTIILNILISTIALAKKMPWSERRSRWWCTVHSVVFRWMSRLTKMLSMIFLVQPSFDVYVALCSLSMSFLAKNVDERLKWIFEYNSSINCMFTFVSSSKVGLIPSKYERDYAEYATPLAASISAPYSSGKLFLFCFLALCTNFMLKHISKNDLLPRTPLRFLWTLPALENWR